MYVYHPPATVGLPAIVISMLRRIPFVVDIQDLWPDTLESTGMVRNAFILSLVGLWCRVVYALAARITVLSRGFQEALVERSVPRDKVVVIYNWCDESQVIAESPSQSLANSLGLAGKFVIVFAGNMGRAQQLDTVLDAAASLAAREPNVRFVFVGSGIESERLKRRVSSEHIGNVLFVPRQSVTDVGRYLALGDALLVNLSNDALFRITIPSKTQAYLACGKPLLMAVSGEAAELVEGAGAGIACEPGNPQALAEAVSTLRRMSRSERDAMGERAIAFYWSKLALSIGTERFEQVFREVAQC
jgi:glycosyltransferase involved in cell wall biosynthesis